MVERITHHEQKVGLMGLVSLLVAFQIFLMLLADSFLVDDSLYYEFWQDQLSHDRIEKMLEDGKKWKWLSYLLSPIFLLIKCFLIFSCLYIGCFVCQLGGRMIDLFKIVLLAHFVALLPILVKIFWFGFFRSDFGLADVYHFSPLSVIGIIDSNEIEPWLVYPLRMLNLFEVAYWCILAWQLKGFLGRDFTGSLVFVASTYGLGLLLWMVLVMFISVSFS